MNSLDRFFRDLEQPLKLQKPSVWHGSCCICNKITLHNKDGCFRCRERFLKLKKELAEKKDHYLTCTNKYCKFYLVHTAGGTVDGCCIQCLHPLHVLPKTYKDEKFRDDEIPF